MTESDSSLNDLSVLDNPDVRKALQQLAKDAEEEISAMKLSKIAANRPSMVGGLKHWGVIDARGPQYSLQERRNLIQCLSHWKANLYVFGQLTWEQSIQSISQSAVEEFSVISDQCKRFEVELWAWMKPGDFRYLFHREDRRTFVRNAKKYLELGASGFYLLMDDLHRMTPQDPDSHVRQKDAEYHAKLIAELYAELGSSLKAICGEHYHGAIGLSCKHYWEPILSVLPKHVMITWTGPRIWNKTLQAEDIPKIDWPILLFDNYFASDSESPERSPIYPYEGRSPDLIRHVDAVVINPNNHYAWQYCALRTAMTFWRDPEKYAPIEAFKESVRELGDMYMATMQRE